MRIGLVDLPDKILQAQTDGTLVIFAGAGISMGVPSNLPDFPELADKISAGVVEKLDNEPEDHFLGRVQHSGYNIHKLTQEYIDLPDSFPTPIHQAIISLFKRNEEIRIVTTNFDRHFLTVFNQSDILQKVSVFKAPALPLGNDFEGLVYLHGMVDDPKRMVLNDGDFGKAYLIHGWATQFLKNLFQKYTVLFIGYSHKDIVMSYLARGLTPDTNRFALTADDTSVDDWKFLGITPILFPLIQGPNKYIELEKTLVTWSERSHLGVLDHEQRIRELVLHDPPLDPEEIDYLRAALEDPVLVQFFVRHARSLSWLTWVGSQPRFKKLFDPIAQLTQEEIYLASWFAENYCSNNVFESLEIVEQNGTNLNRITWSAIARHLWCGDPKPVRKTIEIWVTVLMTCPESTWDINMANYLLGQCGEGTDRRVETILFECLTRPKIKLKPHIILSESEKSSIRADAVLIGDEYWLRKAWTQIFFPILPQYATTFETIFLNHLTNIHNSLFALGLANENWDRTSWHRSAIEPHQQDKYTNDEDILIDGLRDVLVSLGINNPTYTISKVTLFSSSDNPLLHRMGIHLISECLRLSSDQKIELVLQHNWLYKSNLKHEVFRLLHISYPTSSVNTKRDLLNAMLIGPFIDSSDERRNELKRYEIFNLAVWLHQIAPDCPLADSSWQEQCQNNPQFSEREHPDFNFWRGDVTWGDRSSSISVEMFLTMSSDEKLKLLLDYKDEQADFFRGTESLFEIIGQAVRKSFEKTWGLVEMLNSHDEVPVAAWSSILRGWNGSNFGSKQWELVFGILLSNLSVQKLTNEVADLILQGLTRDDGQIPTEMFNAVENLLDILWIGLETESSKESDYPPAAQLALCWLHIISKRKKNTGDVWVGLSVSDKKPLNSIIKSEHFTSISAKSMLAENLFFLYETDSEWTKINLLPLFDWNKSQRVANTVWRGYLNGGRIHPELINFLLELYVQTASRLEELSVEKEQFCNHIANIALNAPNTIEKLPWILRILSLLQIAERIKLADSIGFLMRNAEKKVIENVWNNWLEDYWNKRNNGIPVSLTHQEAAEMIEWIPMLDVVFPRVVKLVEEMPILPSSIHGLLFKDLKETAKKWPSETAILASFLLHEFQSPFYDFDDIIEIVNIVAGKCSKDSLINICDDLARLGLNSAFELRKFVDSCYQA